MDTKKAAMIAAICGAAVFLGVLLPWYSVSMDFGELGRAAGIGGSSSRSFNGTQGDFMGTFTLILGLLGGAAALFLWRGAPQGVTIPRRNLAWAAVGAFGLATLLTFVDLMRDVPSHSGPGFSAGRGFGIYLTLLAAAGGAALSFLVLRATPAAPAAPPTPPPTA